MQALDVMTKKVITVTGQTPVEEVAKVLLDHHVSAVPVIDAAGAVLGIVSEGDLMRRLAEPEAPRRSWWLELFAGSGYDPADDAKRHGRTAADVMTSNVQTVAEDTALADVARLLETRRIKRVPVLRDGKVVGIVSRANLLQAMASAPPPEETPGVEGRVQRERILEELAKVAGIRVSLVNVIVRDGQANVWGAVESDVEENAVRRAVESVVGEGNAQVMLGRIPPWSYGGSGL
ncbi:MAG: CBS domain-containing protein [Rhodobacteraceae bacterium]|nr:CBS domain-containing protein [Paracoccaceae bacterium]